MSGVFHSHGTQFLLHNVVNIVGISSWINDVPGRVCTKVEKIVASQTNPILKGLPDKIVGFPLNFPLARYNILSPDSILSDQ